MPGCVAVARRTLNPLALVRIQARQLNSPIAQSVERAAVNRKVVGSSPTRGAKSYPFSTNPDKSVPRQEH